MKSINRALTTATSSRLQCCARAHSRTFSLLFSLVLTVSLTFVLAPMPSAHAEKNDPRATCEELWFQRNSIFANTGYCFKSAEAQAVFGAACFPPFGKLSREQESDVNQLAALEAVNGCDPKGQAWGTSVFRPVIVGHEPELEACTSMGEIAGLSPNGDGFLSVRTGPKGKEVDRVTNGRVVNMCDSAGDWVGIVYPNAGQDPLSCGVARSFDKPKTYTGPCHYGWVHKDFVQQISG